LELDGMHGVQRSSKSMLCGPGLMKNSMDNPANLLPFGMAGPCSTYPSRLEEDGLDFDMQRCLAKLLYMRLPLTDSLIRSDEMQMGVQKKKNAEQNH